MKEIDILKSFGLFLLGSVVGGMILGAVAGFLVGIGVAVTGGALASVQSGAQLLGLLAGLAVSYFMFRIVVLKMIVPRVARPADA